MKSSSHLLYPGLSTAMDIRAVTEIFQDALKKEHPHLDVVSGKILNVKQNTHQRCAILYSMRLKNNLLNRTRSCLITAHVFDEGEELPHEPSAMERAPYERIKKVWIKRPTILVPEERMCFYPFPSDIALPWLIDAVDPDSMKRRLSRLSAFQGTKVRKAKVRTLGYYPHMRASLVYEVLIEDKRTKERAWHQLIGKTNAFKRPERLFGATWALWQTAKGSIGFARPVGFLLHPRLTLQEKIEGHRLGDVLKSPFLSDIMSEVARQLAAFHCLSVPLPVVRKLRHEIRSLKHWTSVLTRVRPDLRKHVKRLRDGVRAAMEKSMRVCAPIHADFQHTNVFLDGRSVYLLDLDEAAYGDPCLDVGRLLASLRIPSLRTFGDVDAIAKERELFVEEYLRRRPENVRRIRLFEAASLLISAASVFRTQRPHWKSEIEILLSGAERAFQSSNGAPSISRKREKDRYCAIAPNEPLRWALDTRYMQAALSAAVSKSYNAELNDCEVRKLRKRGSVYRISYRLSGWSDKRKWKCNVVGLTFERGHPGIIFDRLVNVRRSLEATAGESLLPRPIAFIPEIETLIIEPARGRSLSSLLTRTEAKEAVGMLARGLFHMHQVAAPPEKAQPMARELAIIRTSLEQVRKENPGFHKEAIALFSEIEKREDFSNGKASPIFYSLRPQHIFLARNRLCVMGITRLRFSHPYIDIGNFLAQLILAGIGLGKLQEIETVAAHFRTLYQSASGIEENEILPFECAALIRVACRQSEKESDGTLSSRLLDYAEQRMSRVG